VHQPVHVHLVKKTYFETFVLGVASEKIRLLAVVGLAQLLDSTIAVITQVKEVRIKYINFLIAPSGL
jgi:hypothetical protein